MPRPADIARGIGTRIRVSGGLLKGSIGVQEQGGDKPRGPNHARRQGPRWVLARLLSGAPIPAHRQLTRPMDTAAMSRRLQFICIKPNGGNDPTKKNDVDKPKIELIFPHPRFAVNSLPAAGNCCVKMLRFTTSSKTIARSIAAASIPAMASCFMLSGASSASLSSAAIGRAYHAGSSSFAASAISSRQVSAGIREIGMAMPLVKAIWAGWIARFSQ